MLFSEHFKIRPSPADKWYDPILSLDTRLFIDPFLIGMGNALYLRADTAQPLRPGERT